MLSAAVAGAQAYPERPIRVIIASPPGGSNDLSVRSVTPEMSRILGQPLVVENRPGAGGVIGYEYLARQVPADGYTIGGSAAFEMIMLPLTAKELRFDPQKDLVPVIGIGTGRLVFVSPAASPWKTFNELVAYSKANPGKLNHGTTGSSVLIVQQAVLNAFGINATHVPYSGGPPVYNALAAGNIQMGFVTEAGVIQLGDKVRLLGVTGDQRYEPYLDVPTFAELGFPNAPLVRFIFSAPAATPKPILEKLSAVATQALQAPEVRARLAKIQLRVDAKPGDAISKEIAEQSKLYSEVAKKARILPQ